MRHAILAASFFIAIMACPFAQAQSTHGDGSSPEQAVDLSSAHSETEGIQAEHAWLEQHYPGARMKQQDLIIHPQAMDRITIELPSGEERVIYFDISSFFGKT